MLIEHADVRRLLLAQKSYAEGSMALCLFGSSLFENQNSAPTEELRIRNAQLLDLLTPIIKSWPSKYGCISNDMAIQILGGAGYTREYPVEQLYRDQRLNPIHEGAEAIHGLDLLGRKLTLYDGAGYRYFKEDIAQDIASAKQLVAVKGLAERLENAVRTLEKTTQALQQQMAADIDQGLANATVYLDMFGRIVGAWIWLKQGLIAANALTSKLHESDEYFYRGKLQAASYYIEWELPSIEQYAELLESGNTVTFEMKDEWF